MKPHTNDSIRLAREARGYSQEFIAKKLGITQQAYSQGEKNPDSMTLKRLRELSKILDVPLLTLIGEDNIFVQQNYNQHGGNAAAQMIVHGVSEDEKALYDKIIEEQKNTIGLLSDLLRNK
jgi:transcriptional regulator with XRE-family HTH domain